MLNAKQLLFVKEYLVDLNATQAVIRAGYSAKYADRTGPRMLGNVGIRKAIEDGKAKRIEKTEITADYVLRRINEEANFFEEGASHSARVAALKLLANHTDVCKEKHEVTGKDGAAIEHITEIVVRTREEASALLGVVNGGDDDRTD